MKLWIHALLVALLACGATLLSLEEPQFGDDFTYWTYGFNVHEHGLSAWTDDGFHQLRWPIWGLCWLGQGLFGYGLVSYYLQPVLMMMLGAVLAFFLGWKLFRRESLAWGCGIIFMFQPVMDMNLTRPFPDVAEGVFGTCAVFAWWALMEAKTRGRMVWTTLACGLCLFLTEENRLTGVFFIPLLGCLTLLFYPRRWLRAALPIAVFAVLLAGQMAFYQVRFGHWDHFLRANSGAKGKPGTEAITAVWKIPFRFLNALYRGGVLYIFSATFATLGGWFAWRRFGRPGRLVLAWVVLLYLAYACAPQQLWPFRPLLRIADRFLSALMVPYAVLIMMGLLGTFKVLAKRWPRAGAGVDWVRRHPAAACVIGTLLMFGAALPPIGERSIWRLGYIPALQAHLRELPAQTPIFTHPGMVALAHMMDTVAASRLRWLVEDKGFTDAGRMTADSTAKASEAVEFWYIRKLAQLRFTKGAVTENETSKLGAQPKFSPWLDEPWANHWRLERVLVNNDNPDIVIYGRRPEGAPAALILNSDSPELKGLLPPLPFTWKKGDTDYFKKPAESTWTIPPALVGRKVRIEIEGKSDEREPFVGRLSFDSDRSTELALKSYFYRDGGKDFLCVAIPPAAKTLHVRLHFSKNTDWLTVSRFRVIVD